MYGIRKKKSIKGRYLLNSSIITQVRKACHNLLCHLMCRNKITVLCLHFHFVKVSHASNAAVEGRERSSVISLNTEVLSDDQVSCTITKFTRPGEAQIGVVLTAAALKAMYL